MENIGWLQFVFLSECVLSNLRWMFNGKYIIPLKYWIRLRCWVRRIGKVLGETDPILTSIQFILGVSLLGTNRLTIGLTISWITKEAIAAVSCCRVGQSNSTFLSTRNDSNAWMRQSVSPRHSRLPTADPLTTTKMGCTLNWKPLQFTRREKIQAR